MKPSKLDIHKHKGEVLDQIMAAKRQEVPKQMELAPLAGLADAIVGANGAPDYAGACGLCSAACASRRRGPLW